MNSVGEGDAASIGNKPQSNRKPLVGRLGSIFSSKSSHFSEFSVELDDPYKQHTPGDTVQGKVILHVAKPLGVTHIVACLHGSVQVFKPGTKARTGVRANGMRIATGQGRRWTSEYYGDGFLSLFEDELVLCGEGRLDPKLYHFKFELDFPRDLKLPSSIEFERGAIKYSVSVTLTRPTTMNASTTRECNVNFKDDVDVATLPLPKPRAFTLKPIQRSKKRNALQKHASHTASPMTGSLPQLQRELSPVETVPESRHSSTPTQSIASARAASPGHQSDQSGVSSNNNAYETVPNVASLADARSSRTSQSYRSDRSLLRTSNESNDTITASIQLQRAGCLPGDSVSLNVTINHTRPVRSVNGVIATLWRQARVDAHPNLPVGPIKGGKTKFEDYYPRSRTGLGGLSLSNAGSSQAFRKDIYQTFAPLYIDQHTMSANVKATVRVPTDAFPSIRNAPGEMISFKYFVEVIIDIHGKLNQAELEASKSDARSSNGKYAPNAGSDVFEHEEQQGGGTWGSSCIDTTALQRDKNAVTASCELFVGTRNSARTAMKGKRRAVADQAAPATSPQNGLADTASYTSWEHSWPDGHAWPQNYYDNNGYQTGSNDEYYEGYEYGYYDQNNIYPHSSNDAHAQPSQTTSWPGYSYSQYPFYADADDTQHRSGTWYEEAAPSYSFPVPTGDESSLPEKERIRLAEARLLPSAPPIPTTASAPTTTGTDDQTPSAPIIPEEAHVDLSQASPISATDSRSHDRVNSPGPTNRRLPALDTASLDSHPRHPHTPPPIEAHRRDESRPSHDGKHLHDRTRLQEEEASSPMTVVGEHFGQPSAPPLNTVLEAAHRQEESSVLRGIQANGHVDQDTFANTTAGVQEPHGENLPQYER